LKPDPVNPRLHSKKQIRQIANSIREFGFNTPVLIDRDGNVMCGHGRLLACRELGMTEVPTVRLDHLTPAQARAFMIADNRLTEIATWDDRLLAEQLRDLTLLGLGPQADGHILLEQERLMAVVVGVTEHLSPCVGRVAKNGKRQNDYAQDF
jgi:ParB-like chromosome segregation protein Spo0J